VFLSDVHELLGVGQSVVGGVVGFVKHCVSGGLHFTCCRILEPDVSVGGGEAEENTSGGVGGVDFVALDSWLLDSHMTTEYAKMG